MNHLNGTWDMGQWDKICSIISRVCGAKVHALFSITQLFVRLFVRDNVCSHAEAQRAQSSHRELCFPQNCIRPADNVYFVPQKWRKSRKFDSQSDWREDFFITEETEIKRNNGKIL